MPENNSGQTARRGGADMHTADKFKALFLALAFPVFYYFVRLAAYNIWLPAVRHWERAAAPGLDETMLAGRVADAMARYTPFILMTGAASAVLILLALFSRKRGGLPAVAGMSPMRGRGVILRLALLGTALNISLAALLPMLPIPAEWFASHESGVTDALAASGFWVQALCAAVIVPIAEEVVFRGLSHNFLKGSFPPAAALLCQAVIFAGFHGTALQMVYVFPAALALGAVYAWQGTLRAPILLHMAFNAVSLFGVPLPRTLPLMAAVFCTSAAVSALCLVSIRRASLGEKPLSNR